MKMKREHVEITSLKFLIHNVLELITTKPKDYHFEPGQATDLALDKERWKDEKRPFTFTNLPSENHLQFNIKVYPSHDGVTEQLGKLKAGDEISIGEAYGAITYKGEGTFLAGGAGITPFIAILKSLDKENKLDNNSLLFANKTEKDIFLKDMFESLLGQRYLNILSEEKTNDHLYGHIDKAFIKNNIGDLSQNFYVCGPPKMIESITENLKEMGVDSERIITEDFDD